MRTLWLQKRMNWFSFSDPTLELYALYRNKLCASTFYRCSEELCCKSQCRALVSTGFVGKTPAEIDWYSISYVICLTSPEVSVQGDTWLGCCTVHQYSTGAIPTVCSTSPIFTNTSENKEEPLRGMHHVHRSHLFFIFLVHVLLFTRIRVTKRHLVAPYHVSGSHQTLRKPASASSYFVTDFFREIPATLQFTATSPILQYIFSLARYFKLYMFSGTIHATSSRYSLQKYTFG